MSLFIVWFAAALGNTSASPGVGGELDSQFPPTLQRFETAPVHVAIGAADAGVCHARTSPPVTIATTSIPKVAIRRYTSNSFAPVDPPLLGSRAILGCESGFTERFGVSRWSRFGLRGPSRSFRHGVRARHAGEMTGQTIGQRLDALDARRFVGRTAEL